MADSTGACPNCGSGDLITISMVVGERVLAFTTCHHCEAKWWDKDGERVPFRSVIGMVADR